MVRLHYSVIGWWWEFLRGELAKLAAAVQR